MLNEDSPSAPTFHPEAIRLGDLLATHMREGNGPFNKTNASVVLQTLDDKDRAVSTYQSRYTPMVFDYLESLENFTVERKPGTETFIEYVDPVAAHIEEDYEDAVHEFLASNRGRTFTRSQVRNACNRVRQKYGVPGNTHGINANRAIKRLVAQCEEIRLVDVVTESGSRRTDVIMDLPVEVNVPSASPSSPEPAPGTFPFGPVLAQAFRSSLLDIGAIADLADISADTMQSLLSGTSRLTPTQAQAIMRVLIEANIETLSIMGYDMATTGGALYSLQAEYEFDAEVSNC